MIRIALPLPEGLTICVRTPHAGRSPDDAPMGGWLQGWIEPDEDDAEDEDDAASFDATPRPFDAMSYYLFGDHVDG
jgi:hypothetical protein